MGQNSSIPKVDLDTLQKYADDNMEEELALRHIQFVRNKAVEAAELRERIGWEVMAASTMTGILLIAGSMYKRKDLVVPIVPLIMGVGYRYDIAYGKQLSSIHEAAEELLRKDPQRFQPIGGPITLAQVDAISKTL